MYFYGMKSKGIILQASARSNGNTKQVVSFLQEQTNYDVVWQSTKCSLSTQSNITKFYIYVRSDS